MKITIDTKVDTKDEVLSAINAVYDNKLNNKEEQQQNQTKPNQPSEKKYYCNNLECKKEITKDVVAYCLHEDNRPRFKGKVYCRDCQLKFGGSA